MLLLLLDSAATYQACHLVSLEGTTLCQVQCYQIPGMPVMFSATKYQACHLVSLERDALCQVQCYKIPSMTSSVTRLNITMSSSVLPDR